MTIQTLPAAPSRSNGGTPFALVADAFVAALEPWGVAVQAVGDQAGADAATAAIDAATATAQAGISTTQAGIAQASAATAVNAPGTNATSSTSLTIGTGAKSLTIQTGKDMVVGMTVKIANTASPTNWMAGDITAYNSGTGALDVTINVVNGSGTVSTWTVSLSAPSTTKTLPRVLRTSNTMLAAADNGKLFDLSGDFTQTFDAAATLGAGWWCYLQNASANGAQTEQLSNTALSSYEGADVVVNGTFATDTSWTKGSGWTITGGTAVASNVSAGTITPTVEPLTLGAFYKYTYTVTVTSGNAQLQSSGGGAAQIITASGTYTAYHTANDVKFRFARGDTSFTGTVDNVSAIPISITFPALTIGKKYRAIFTIDTLTQGGLGVQVGAQKLRAFTSAGVCTAEFYADSAATTATFYTSGTTMFVGTLGSTVSILEVTPSNVTLDPNSTELIDGVSSFVMYPGECRLVQCDGTGFNSIVLKPFQATFVTTTSFSKPPGYSAFGGYLWGGGGSGARASSTRGAGGGGGGACAPFTLDASILAATETITIAAGGAGQTLANTSGIRGGASSVGTLVFAYGGFGGTQDATPGSQTGGTGGSMRSEGLGSGHDFGGSASATDATYGGAGGGVTTGANSIYGGGGGGGGDGSTSVLGGASDFGGFGGSYNQSTSGGNGAAPGGGGGGTLTGTQSGAGGGGRCKLWGMV